MSRDNYPTRVTDKDVSDPPMKHCFTCEGRGMIDVDEGEDEEYAEECPECGGTGEVPR